SQLTGLSVLGSHQKWVDKTASRTPSTDYRNNSGRPIAVSVYFQGSAAGRRLQVGETTSSYTGICTFSSSTPLPSFAIVPDGHYYRISDAGTIFLWSEMELI